MNIQEVEESIAILEQAIANAPAVREQINARRRPLLVADDAKGLDKLDREIAEQGRKELRDGERLAVLRDERTRLNQDAERARLDDLQAQNEARAECMKKRLDVISSHFTKLVPLLAAQAVDFEFFEADNRRLMAAGLRAVTSPEHARREPVVETPERVVEEKVRPAGVYDGAGNAVDVGGALPTLLRTTIPATRTGGREPAPLHLTAILPPVYWGGPGWIGGDTLGHHSEVQTPASARKAAAADTNPANAE